MTIRCRSAAAALALLLSGVAEAQQAQPPAAALDRLFPRGEPVCYARRYDTAHLRRHPRQSVTSARLMRGYQQIRGDAARPDGEAVYVELIVTYRDSGARRFLGGATCRSGEDGTIICASDSCDGGSFPLRPDGADAILVGLKRGRSHFTVSGGCGDGGPSRSLTRGSEDDLFRLVKAPMQACR